MSRETTWVPFTVGCALGWAATGCGEHTPGNADDPLTDEWKTTERAYPFAGEAGETVCLERRRRTAEGFLETDREFYHFGTINDELDGRRALEPGAREMMRSLGLTRVTTCEGARTFMRLQQEYFESFPSLGADSKDLPNEALPSVPVDKVREGNAYDHWPTVRLLQWSTATGQIVSTCSGVLLNEFAILTSAHCFASSGLYPVSVDFGTAFANDPAAGNWCLSSNSPNCLNVMPSPSNMMVFRHPGFTGTTDTSDDIAVVVEWDWEPWRIIGDDPNYYLRFTNQEVLDGTSFWIQGYGANALSGSGVGLGRRSRKAQTIAWVGTGYWLSYATEGYGQPCEGDSGSSAINTTRTPYDISVGICSNFNRPSGSSNACPLVGDKFRYTQTWPKRNWINQVMLDSGSPTCTDSASNGWRWTQCW